MGALDKVSVGQAAIYGMTADTHLVGQNYSCKCGDFDFIIQYVPDVLLLNRDKLWYLLWHYIRRPSADLPSEEIHNQQIYRCQRYHLGSFDHGRWSSKSYLCSYLSCCKVHGGL